MPAPKPAFVWNGRYPDVKGTLGCLVRLKTDSTRLFILGSAHVLAPLGNETMAGAFGDAIFCDVDGIGGPVGKLFDWTAFDTSGGCPNGGDAALAEVTKPEFLSPLLQRIVCPTGIANGVSTDEEIVVHGAMSSGPCRGRVQETSVQMEFPQRYFPDDMRWVGYSGLFTTDAITVGGDSGAAAYDTNGNVAGLLVGGFSIKHLDYFCPIQPLLDRLNVECVTADMNAGSMRSEDLASAVPTPTFSNVRLPGPNASPIGYLPRYDDCRVATDVLARTLWGEARGEGERGLRAVAAVVVNRGSRSQTYWWGATIEAVCIKPWQFSCWNVSDPNRAAMLGLTNVDPQFAGCLSIARDAVDDRNIDETRGATHYHNRLVHPAWSVSHQPCAVIGNHLFYNDIEPA